NDANYAWTIVADAQVAGHMLCLERDEKREVGYWLGRAYWGRGIATAAPPPRCCAGGPRPRCTGPWCGAELARSAPSKNAASRRSGQRAAWTKGPARRSKR